MNERLKKSLIAAAGTGALAIAAVLGAYFEGTGPTRIDKDTGQLVYIPYKDPVGILTVCRGVTGPEVQPGRTYTEAQCAAMEAIHYINAERAARRLFPAYPTYNEWQQASIIDWLYNLGVNDATMNSTLRRKFNSGDIAGGCREMVKWVNGRVKGKLQRLNGLVTRREATQEICLNWGAVK